MIVLNVLSIKLDISTLAYRIDVVACPLQYAYAVLYTVHTCLALLKAVSPHADAHAIGTVFSIW